MRQQYLVTTYHHVLYVNKIIRMGFKNCEVFHTEVTIKYGIYY